MNRNKSLFNRAKAIIPSGMNSPVHVFGNAGGIPHFIKKAEGAYAWDENGTRYTDYVGSWGPAIIGHTHPKVIEAAREAALGGLSFGAPTEGEIAIAEEVAKIIPSIKQLRLVSFGTEATMIAIRLARGFTSRDKIVKFEGCYHGHSDNLLVKAGNGLLTFGNPSSAGVSASFTKHTLVLEYNNVAQLGKAFAQGDNDIAYVVLGPFVGSMNLIRPSEASVKALRELTEKRGAVLIYDEVMTGFRMALGGAQPLHGIKSDLTTMGEVIDGDMPLTAFDDRRDIMECISPLGGVYQAGILSGNPTTVAAGLKTLEIIQREGFYENLTTLTQRLASGMTDAAKARDVEFTADSVGDMFNLYFANHAPQNYADIARSSIEGLKHFFYGMPNRNVAFGPSAYEADFVSTAHTPKLTDGTTAAAREVFKEMVK